MSGVHLHPADTYEGSADTSYPLPRWNDGWRFSVLHTSHPVLLYQPFP